MTLLTKFMMLDLIEEPHFGHGEAEEEGAPRHAFLTSPRRAGIFKLCYLPLCLGTLLNAGALHGSEYDYISRNSRWTFAIGVFLICMGTTGMQLSHKGAKGGGLRLSKSLRTGVRTVLSCCTLLLAALPWPTDLTQLVAETENHGHAQSQLFDAGRVFLLCELCLVLLILLFDRYSRTARSERVWQTNSLIDARAGGGDSGGGGNSGDSGDSGGDTKLHLGPNPSSGNGGDGGEEEVKRTDNSMAFESSISMVNLGLEK